MLIRNLSRQLAISAAPARRFGNKFLVSHYSNEGRKGPLTGQEKQPKPNEGRKGPLTGQKRKQTSSEGKSASQSQSTQGAEASDAPSTASGQGMEDMGGHAIPSGPGKDSKFAEQGNSALDVAGSGRKDVGNENEEGRDQKVDPKFWSDKK